jgi:hypothetical protein
MRDKFAWKQRVTSAGSIDRWGLDASNTYSFRSIWNRYVEVALALSGWCRIVRYMSFVRQLSVWPSIGLQTRKNGNSCENSNTLLWNATDVYSVELRYTCRPAVSTEIILSALICPSNVATTHVIRLLQECLTCALYRCFIGLAAWPRWSTIIQMTPEDGSLFETLWQVCNRVTIERLGEWACLSRWRARLVSGLISWVCSESQQSNARGQLVTRNVTENFLFTLCFDDLEI